MIPYNLNEEKKKLKRLKELADKETKRVFGNYFEGGDEDA